MAANSGKKNTMFTEINITPLTDIFLVLLIIMMVVAPTFQSMDNAITMPEINSGVAIEQQNAMVSVTRDGSIYEALLEVYGNAIRVTCNYAAFQNTLAALDGYGDIDIEMGMYYIPE